jgi:Tfp pilus assembly protein PilF
MDEQVRLRYLKDIEYFSNKFEKNPKSKVFMPLALAYLKLGKLDEAIDVCQRGLDLNPDYIAAKTIMAQAFLEKGMKEEAKGLLIEIATLNKSNYRANKLLGEIYRSEDNIEKAVYYYRTALQTSPEDTELKNLIEELADVSEVKPSTLEEIEFEQAQEEDSEEEKEDAILEEADALVNAIESDDMLKESPNDLLELEEKVDNLLKNRKFEDARSFVKDNFEDEDYKNKKLKEIDLEEQLYNDGMKEDITEIIIPDESDENIDLIDSIEMNEEINIDIQDTNIDEENDELKIFEDGFGIDEDSLIEKDEILFDDQSLSEDESPSVLDNIDLQDEKDEEAEEIINGESNQDITSIDESFENILDEKIDTALESNETQVVNINQSAISRLENWLENIKKVKSTRDV